MYHQDTKVRILHFLSSCQYTYGVARRLLGLYDTLSCVFIHTIMCLYTHYHVSLSVFVKLSIRPGSLIFTEDFLQGGYFCSVVIVPGWVIQIKY